MNNKELRERAKEFCHKDTAFIHTEVKNGTPETMLSGDALAIAHGIVGQISRLSELMGGTFTDTINIIGLIRVKGYSSVRKYMEDTDDEYREIEGEDWQDKWKEEQQVELDRQLRNKDIEIARLEKEIKRLEISVQIHKGNTENARKELAEKTKAFNKELKEKENRIRELVAIKKISEDDLK